MSETINGSIYQAPGGGTALLEGVTDDAVFGSMSGHGFIASGGTTTLVDLPGYSTTAILGLNESGNVGYGIATSATNSTYFVDNNGALTTLPAGETPVGVDNKGDVLIDAAESRDVSGPSFLLNNGVATPVVVPGYDAEATAISPSGVLAGSLGSNDGQYFVGTPGHTVVYDDPSQDEGAIDNFAPSAVNDAGDVGLSGSGFGYALIVHDGTVTATYYDPFGSPSFVSINSEGDGLVVDRRESVLLTPDGNFNAFNVPLGSLLVTGLNDDGTIVGNGSPDNGNSFEGFVAEVPCFASGTLIAVAAGQVAVEDLREGDLVRTAGGQLCPVVWTGRRSVDLQSHPDPDLVRPVVIRAGAFGPAVPARDLRVSPDHNIAVEDVLIPAKCLVNGTNVVVDAQATAVTYHHVELATHDLLLAEGLAAESYLDVGNRAALMPGADDPADFASAVDAKWFDWEARGCRRLVLVGPEIDRARAHFGARAAATARPPVREREERSPAFA